MFRHVQAGGCCVSLVTWCGQLFILFGLGITYLAIMTAAMAVTFFIPLILLWAYCLACWF